MLSVLDINLYQVSVFTPYHFLHACFLLLSNIYRQVLYVETPFNRDIFHDFDAANYEILLWLTPSLKTGPNQHFNDEVRLHLMK